jgi:hypothetical protein
MQRANAATEHVRHAPAGISQRLFARYAARPTGHPLEIRIHRKDEGPRTTVLRRWTPELLLQTATAGDPDRSVAWFHERRLLREHGTTRHNLLQQLAREPLRFR